ncbi:MAG: DUF1275 domain-containing protein [Alphaproteobacteria bacterium]|nr:DUF1275 domain-containing protein [Alphaproteobacteria bacterium]
MSDLSPQQRSLAVLLAALAGFVDAYGYRQLGGFFVSFMSGNTTKLAVGLATHLVPAGVAVSLVASFVAGAFLGALLRGFLGPRPTCGLLIVVALLLAVATGLGSLGYALPSGLSLAGAMGTENELLFRRGEGPFGVTYVTGVLVQLGQDLAAALRGGAPLGWTWQLALWLGLLAGALVGALSFPVLHTGALAAATLATLVLAAGARHWGID